ncbi:GDP-L-fucose synthase family protein [Candidatus Nitrospira inopinata]|jgi:GDP-L-fucose synthase|uniref:GDP-L-fucose synthase n=1 Tax=Candidatus Nitrospira inopinata TaxID=1715989 RepID=A0A0S4KVE8_9BACT|nr:GDP-L-fucose synthase [Candidatus Nitrospira inopinata]CUQ68085.1 bifunctional GDP-fucose synthetase: GDP-4-dehydro-6-deoxy-D-mannose epimerase and GDP-4-dehydro-6-L-deoxygalactose reductase [Candidatus Nitrospira inopinata]
MEKEARIYVAGHRGMVGSAVLRLLQSRGYANLLVKTSNELDLRDGRLVAQWFTEAKPDYVIVAAAKVGGIWANNTRPAEFIYDNLAIQTNLIHQAHLHGVRKLLLLGSSCIYPRDSPQPIREEHLLTGPLEKTNEWYAVAKIAGIKMCQAYRRQYGRDFIAAMPTNLYGPNDNFDLESAHVLPALIRRFHEAKQSGVAPTLWGSGTPRREFLHVDDCAEACLSLMDGYSGEEIVNVGAGRDISIAELATLVAEAVGYRGEIRWDRTKPDGTPRKLMDSSKVLAMGWRPRIGLREGIERTYEWYRAQVAAEPLVRESVR